MSEIRFWYALLAINLLQLGYQAYKDDPSWLGVVANLIGVIGCIIVIEMETPAPVDGEQP